MATSDELLTGIQNPKQTSRIETQMILQGVGPTLESMSFAVPVAIEITFPTTWLTAWIERVSSLECRLELTAVTDASHITPHHELKENRVPLILKDSP